MDPVALDEEERESERECLGAGGSDDGLGMRGAIRGTLPFWLWLWLWEVGTVLLAAAEADALGLLEPSARGFAPPLPLFSLAVAAAAAAALKFEMDEERELSSEGTDEFDSAQ